MNRWLAGGLMVAVLCGPAWPDDEHHAHPAPERLGTVSFATSCAARVAGQFERGVALLHSFAYDAAQKAFSEVAAADPACAMAQWGLAMSYWHQLWSPPEPDELAAGNAALGAAAQLTSRSTREQLFIAAATAYFRDFEHRAPGVRAQAYVHAMGVLAKRFPRDAEVQIFYALALVSTAPPDDRSHANQKRAGAILEPLYRAHPDHPGIAHYLIHTYDSAELAPRGLAAARAYARIAPSVPHALHMPSHIFTRLGLWDDSIASNQAARAAAQREGDEGEELHAMDYLAYAYLQRGRDADAEQLVSALAGMGVLPGSDFKVGYAATAMPVRLAMERHRWEVARGLQPLPQSAPHVAAVVYWARAEASARAGQPQAADEDIARIEACGAQLAASGNRYWQSQVHVLGLEAHAWQAAARGDALQASRLLQQAADEEDAVEKLPVTPGPIVPAREQLGDLLLTLHQPREALAAYRAALQQAPGRRGSLKGGIESAALIGDAATATQLRGLLAAPSRGPETH